MTDVQYNETPITRSVGQSRPYFEGDEKGNVKTVQALLAVRVVTAGSVTYVGEAQIGSASSSAVWRVKKIDTTTGTIVTWADGNEAFDNVFDDYATLTYA